MTSATSQSHDAVPPERGEPLLPPEGPRIDYIVRCIPEVSETFVINEIQEHLRSGWDIRVWSLRTQREEIEVSQEWSDVIRCTEYQSLSIRDIARLAGNVSRVAWRSRRRFLTALSWALKWTLKERDLKIVLCLAYASWIVDRGGGRNHVHAQFATSPATVAKLVTDLTGCNYSITGHAIDIYVSTSREFLQEKIDTCLSFICVSEASAMRLRAMHPRGEDKVLVVRNGLGREMLQCTESAPKKECCSIVSVGRLVEKKGHDDLLKAVSILYGRGLDVSVTIVGAGPLEDALRRCATDLGIGGVTRWTGALPPMRVRDELRRASVFCLCCKRDTNGDEDNLPVAITEALACSVPVVSTRVGGIPEAAVHGESGLLAEPGDVIGIADALEEVLVDRELRDRLGASGRSRVRRAFSREAEARKLRENVFLRGIEATVRR